VTLKGDSYEDQYRRDSGAKNRTAWAILACIELIVSTCKGASVSH